MQGEVELRRGELGHGLDEDVRDDFILDAVGVELVASTQSQARLARRGPSA